MDLTSITPMASDPPASAPPPRGRTVSRKRSRYRGRVLLLAVLVLSGVAGWLVLRHRDSGPRTHLETEVVAYGDLPREIVTRGELEPSETTDLFCRVKALTGNTFATTIKWVAEQGAWVKRGDLVVLLDDAQFQEDLAQRRVPLEQARSDWLLAVENHKIVVSQNASDIASAQSALRLAELDLKKYVEADHELLRIDLTGRLKMAEADVLAAREHLAFTERMNRKGFASEAQARAERNRAASMQLNVEALRDQLTVLDRYGHPSTLADLQGKVALARHALQLAKEQARSKEAQADIDRLSKQRVYQKLLTRYHEIEAEVAKCRIVAPHEGMVIYHMSEQTRMGSGGYQAIVAEGEQVREGQKLLRIAQLKHLVVRTYVHEALIGHVHGEDEVASREQLQKAEIRLEALPDRVFRGHVVRVGTVPYLINGRMDGTLAFQTLIAIDEPVDGLHPDMSARITIFQDDASPRNVLTVPVDAILPGVGNHRKLYVMKDEGPEEREVVVGFSNDDVAQIVSGLEEGEEVVVHPEELGEERGLHIGGATKHRRAHRR
jgi:multidrug efflux pump subunit AcrA (membrane-fusion protein)